MLKVSNAVAVILVIAITIAANVLLGLWSEKLAYAGTPLNDSLEPLLAWALIALAVVAVVAIVGPKHEQIWSIVLLVLFVTMVGSFLVGQFVLGAYKVLRDYTSLPIDPAWLALLS